MCPDRIGALRVVAAELKAGVLTVAALLLAVLLGSGILQIAYQPSATPQPTSTARADDADYASLPLHPTVNSVAGESALPYPASEQSPFEGAQ